MKFKLICHPSESISSLKKDQTIKDWGLEARDQKLITKISAAGGAVLFGEPPVSILQIENKEIKNLVSDLEAISKKDGKLKANNGLIIVTNAPANTTRKLITLVKSLGGEVDSTSKSDSAKNDAALVKELKLPKNVEEFLIEYAGQETANITSLLRTLSNITEERRKKLTIEELLMRLPLPPGSLPPWDLEKPLFSKNLNKTIVTYRRIAGETGPLLALWNLNKKFQQIYKAAFLIKNQKGMTEKEIMTSIGVTNPNVYKYGIKNHTRIDVEKLEEIVLILAKLDSTIKTGATKPDVRFEVALVEIIEVLKS